MRISDWSSDVCSSDLNADEVIEKAFSFCAAGEPVNSIAATLAQWMSPDRKTTFCTPFLTTVLSTARCVVGKAGQEPLSAFQRTCTSGSPSRPSRAVLGLRSEEHTSELQSLMSHSYA